MKTKTIKVSNNFITEIIEIERKIISFLIRYPNLFFKHLGKLSEYEFCDKIAEELFTVFSILKKEYNEITLQGLMDYLSGSVYEKSVNEILSTTKLPTYEITESEFLILIEKLNIYSNKMKLISFLDESKELLNNSIDPEEVKIKLLENLTTIKKNKSFVVQNVKEILNSYKDFVRQPDEQRARTGFRKVDEAIRGILPGETVCIIGKTSIGKSALLQNIGHNFSSSGLPILFFSLELPDISVAERIIQIETGCDGYSAENLFRNDSETLQHSADLIYTTLSNFYVITESGLTTERIEAYINFVEKYICKQKIGLILIDYLGLLSGKGELYEQVSMNAKQLKEIAKRVNVPIIFLSQTTKQADVFSELNINSTRDSGVVAESVDFLFGIWKKKEEQADSNEIPLVIGLLKNRRGHLGKINIEMNRRNLRMKEINE